MSSEVKNEVPEKQSNPNQGMQTITNERFVELFEYLVGSITDAYAVLEPTKSELGEPIKELEGLGLTSQAFLQNKIIGISHIKIGMLNFFAQNKLLLSTKTRDIYKNFDLLTASIPQHSVMVFLPPSGVPHIDTIVRIGLINRKINSLKNSHPAIRLNYLLSLFELLYYTLSEVSDRRMIGVFLNHCENLLGLDQRTEIPPPQDEDVLADTIFGVTKCLGLKGDMVNTSVMSQVKGIFSKFQNADGEFDVSAFASEEGMDIKGMLKTTGIEMPDVFMDTLQDKLGGIISGGLGGGLDDIDKKLSNIDIDVNKALSPQAEQTKQE